MQNTRNNRSARRLPADLSHLVDEDDAFTKWQRANGEHVTVCVDEIVVEAAPKR